MIHIRRLFSSATLPWKFSNSKAFTLPPVNEGFNFELEQEKESFLYVYDEILKSYENQEIDWLEDAMEPQLFKKLKSGIQEIKENEKKIKILNQEEHTGLTFHNASLRLGVNIDRSTNESIAKPYELAFDNKTRVSQILIYGPDNSIILKVDAVYATKKKLALFDKNGNLIEGDNSEDLEYHKFQFEKMIDFKYMIRDSIKLSLWTFFRRNDLFEGSQWVITDIDDSLDGNPLFKE